MTKGGDRSKRERQGEIGRKKMGRDGEKEKETGGDWGGLVGEQTSFYVLLSGSS